MIETWIDVWAKNCEISNGRGGTLRSYRLFEKAEIPEGAPEIPCALSYVTGFKPKYSTAGPTILFWEGYTEFHLTPNLQMIHIPYVQGFYERILAAAAGDMSLGGTVEYFVIPEQDNAIQMVEMTWGEGPPHRGLLARWQVKENVTGRVTISA